MKLSMIKCFKPPNTNGGRMSNETSQTATGLEPGEDDGAAFESRVNEFKPDDAVRQAQKMEVIGQLAGGVAHDFNNIFVAMILRLELLQLQPLSPSETRASLHDLETLAKRAASLTRRLLLFGQRLVMHPEQVEMNIAITHLLKLLQPILDENITALHLAGTQELWVEADAALLDQAVMSLCLNSRDAMPHGGTLTLETSLADFDVESAQANAESRPGQFVCLRISDTGCGMNADVVSHLFEPFFTTKEAGKGPGLGLTSVYGIVHQHKGWMNVVSVEGKGTSFRLYLPVLEKAKTVRTAIPHLIGGQGHNETILLVDDEVAVRSVCAEALSMFGYRVLSAADGQTAFKIWEQHRDAIDLVLTDMKMPGMDGLDLADKLWKVKPALKIVIMSGFSMETVRDGAAGGAGYTLLSKPFDLETLALTLRHCLD
jgi:signal transduction histidine kinase/CheY-like chemotaxis protein